MTGEDRLIADLHAICATVAPRNIILGIGDDAAVWKPSRSAVSVITTDALVENVHFTCDAMSAGDVGYRALAANLSDIAAMGARPVLATIALAIGPHADAEWIRACYRGMAELATTARCAIVGGDITRASEISLTITVVGDVRPSNLKRRDGARPGDLIALTGPLGASRAGLAILRDRPDLADEPRYASALEHFRRPRPHLSEGKFLGASVNVHALMDSSDGLSTDLARLCRASGVGARIDDAAVDATARQVAQACGADPEAWALGGGEDFVLIAAVAPRAFAHLASRFAQRFGRPLVRVGTFTREPGLRRGDGSVVVASGWDHLSAAGETKESADDGALC